MEKKKGEVRTTFKDLNNNFVHVGDIVVNNKGKKAKLKFGYHLHHIKNLSSPSYGFYFDGDERFYFSEHILRNKKLRVKVQKKNRT